jgi:hypothetical protein
MKPELAPLPKVENIVKYLLENGPCKLAILSQKFNRVTPSQLQQYLKRLETSSHVEFVRREGFAIEYRIPSDYSGLIGIYAKPLPKASSSRIVGKGVWG